MLEAVCSAICGRHPRANCSAMKNGDEIAMSIQQLATDEFLEEMRLLFGAPVVAADNGKIDPGFNCLAVSFVTVYLCRLRSLEVDVCHGSLLFIEKGGANKHVTLIDPHAWVGSPKYRDIDLSIANYEGHKFLPVLHDKVVGVDSWNVRPIMDEAKFQQVFREFRGLPKDRYLLYLHRGRRVFHFDDLSAGAPATCSPPTQDLLKCFPDSALLAKGILHLHRLAEGTRERLGVQSQSESWAELDCWQIDAISELKAAMPACQ